MDLIDTGIEKGLIKFDEENSFVTYIHQNKKRNFNNPEEKVQVEAFLSLILIYGYDVKRIKIYVSVQMGGVTKEADIIVYSDNECESTEIVVECKKEDVTDQEFNKAVDQAYSYSVAEGAKYVWITSRLKNEYYEVPPKKPKSRITITDIPSFGSTKLAPYKYVKGGISQSKLSESIIIESVGDKLIQKFFDLEIVPESELTKIFIQSHQSLWGGGQRNPSIAFDELDKLIFCKIWDEKYTIDSTTKKFRPRKDGEPYQFQIFIEESPKELFNRINKI